MSSAGVAASTLRPKLKVPALDLVDVLAVRLGLLSVLAAFVDWGPKQNIRAPDEAPSCPGAGNVPGGCNFPQIGFPLGLPWAFASTGASAKSSSTKRLVNGNQKNRGIEWFSRQHWIGVRISSARNIVVYPPRGN